MTIVFGLIVGLAFGYALQRGRFCVNTAFRDIWFIRDSTLLRAWATALIIQMIGVQVFVSLKLFAPDMPPFFWMANIVGGFAFGIGMVLAGGCGTGTCYRVGEGMLSSLIALIGFGLATVAIDVGFLKPLQDILRSQVIQIASETPTLPKLLNINAWIVTGLIAIPTMFWLIRAGRASYQMGWSWQATGIALGLISLVAWLSSSATGRYYGLSVTGPIRSVFRFIVEGDPTLLDWGSYLLIGLLFGSFLAAFIYGEAKLRLPNAGRTLQALGGGVLMGFGAQVAGGCNIGHSFTGLSTLALSSIVTTAFIILGAWFTVYLLFVKPIKAEAPEIVPMKGGANERAHA